MSARTLLVPAAVTPERKRPSPGPASGRGGVEKRMALARAFAAAGNVAAAARIYGDLIRRFPGNYLAHKELEKVFLGAGDSRRATALWRGIGRGHPLRRKSFKRLTGIAWRTGDIRRAVSYLRGEMREFGATAKLYCEIGKFHMRARQYVKAVQAFQNALALDRDDREIRGRLGAALMENGNFELAEYEFAEILKERPRDFRALILMAELRIRENRLGEALDILQTIDRHHPDNSRVILCRAEIAFLERRFEEAVRLGELALDGTPFYYVWEQARCHRLLMHAYRARRDVRRARLHGEMQKALQQSRDAFGGLIRVAELKIAGGKPDDGKEILERILELYPGNTRARVALAEALVIEKDDRMAADTAAAALREIPPHFVGEVMRAHAVLAKAWARLGERERAAFHRRQRNECRSRARARWTAGRRGAAPRSPKRGATGAGMLIVAALALALTGAARAAETPEKAYAEAYLLIREARRAEYAGETDVAWQRFRQARAILDRIGAAFPDWNSDGVAAQAKACAAGALRNAPPLVADADLLLSRVRDSSPIFQSFRETRLALGRALEWEKRQLDDVHDYMNRFRDLRHAQAEEAPGAAMPIGEGLWLDEDLLAEEEPAPWEQPPAAGESPLEEVVWLEEDLWFEDETVFEDEAVFEDELWLEGEVWIEGESSFDAELWLTEELADDGGAAPDPSEGTVDLADRDSDGDGISDYDEIHVYGTDPFSEDTDEDGLSDHDEIFIHGTDPLDPDTDGDQEEDGWEIEHGYDPLDEEDPPPFEE
ncbi:MAG: tetratricopeptide repeat protein [bacterium]|nr:tetratricopeptide repeat protein [bacterium]